MVTNNQSGYTDGRKCKYTDDYAGRLLNTNINYITQDALENFPVFIVSVGSLDLTALLGQEQTLDGHSKTPGFPPLRE
jgi:hypothetical protein